MVNGDVTFTAIPLAFMFFTSYKDKCSCIVLRLQKKTDVVDLTYWRSAAAADRLEQAGYENIACITSGLQSVKPGEIIYLNNPVLL